MEERLGASVYLFSVTYVEIDDDQRRASVLLCDVRVNPLIVSAGILFLPFPKWYVVGDAANPSISLGILLGHLDRNANWHRRDAA